MNTNLRYLLLIRMIAISGQILALSVMQMMFEIHIPLIPVISVIVTLGLYTLYSWQHLSKGREVSERTFVKQLLVDIIALTVLVYFTGGSVNPFISLFILPIIFAAASMRPTYTGLVAASAVGCYTFLMFFNVPMLHLHGSNSGAQLHIWGMWYGFMLSACLVAYFISRIAQALRDRDKDLALAREEALRADKAISLGTLAAGTAHELGTPLSTIAVLCKELQNEHQDDTELKRDLATMREQIDHCKSILARMASDAGQLQADDGHVVSVSRYIDEIIQDWKKIRPDITVNVEKHTSTGDPDIIAERTMTQAIINVLNNAADASACSVDIESSFSDNNLLLNVRDKGPGLPEKISNQIGHDIVSTKDEGLGIGLFLAQATLNRMGGKFELSTHHEGGTNATIKIPLGPILAA